MQHRDARSTMSIAPEIAQAAPLARGLRSAGALALAAMLAACGGDAEPEGVDGAGGEASTTAASGDAVPGEAGAAAAGEIPGDPMGGSTPTFVCPEGWSEIDASSSPMRIHVYEKSVEDDRLELIVYEFNNSVGGLEMNLARWAQPRDPATLTDDELKEIEVGEFVVTTLFLEVDESSDAEAADVAHGSVGSGKFFAYIERPGASRVWTVKASGPAASMRAERAALEAFVQDL